MIRLLLFLALALPASAATTITLRPSNSTTNSGDAYLRAAAPTSNFGGAGALVISGSGAGNTNGQFASVLKFDLSVVTSALNSAYGAGNWVLDSVALELTAATPNNVSFNANAAGSIAVQWLTDDSWTETGITWAGQSALLSGGTQSMGSFAYNGANSGTTTYLLSPSAGFIGDLSSGGITSLHLSAADADVSMVLNSRNFGTASNRPALIISASPEPGRFCLLAFGLVSILWRRRS